MNGQRATGNGKRETPRFAILASGRGSNAARLMDLFDEGIGADLALVLSDVPGAAVLDLATGRGYQTEVVPYEGNRDAHEEAVLGVLSDHGVEHLLLAGYMRILSPRFLEAIPGVILNVHPSLLPDFPGLDAAARQWEAGTSVAGATVHVVDEGVDSGPMVVQRPIAVRGDEGPDGLAHRILTEVEHRIYPEAVRFLVADLLAGAPAAPGSVATALLSVADKTGLVDFASRLAACGVRLLASGGTAEALEHGGVPVTRLEEVTGAGELLRGRVKTLHPHVHAGVLADRRNPDHMAELASASVLPIDLVVVNPYPFPGLSPRRGEYPSEARGRGEPDASAEPRGEYPAGEAGGFGSSLSDASGSPSSSGATPSVPALRAGPPPPEGEEPAELSREAITELIDIGGPALMRAAAKNVDGGVTVVTDPADYPVVLSWLEKGLPVHPMVRRRLAATVFAITAAYDRAVAAWASGVEEPPLGPFVGSRALRYGENPHQSARLFVDGSGRGVAAGMLLHGKPLSHNNLLDLDAAYRAVAGDGPHRCAVVKHTNPCGLAEADDQPAALAAAIAGDPVAAFGGVIGFNRLLEAATARDLLDSGLFVECIAAPGFEPEAVILLRDRRQLRLLDVAPADPVPGVVVHAVGGGLLVQEPDPGPEGSEAWKVVTTRPLPDHLWDEVRFAMRAVAALTSNAVCVTRDRSMRGMGAGMVSRIDACRLALEKAGEHAEGAVLASDGFFPFDDSVRLAAASGIAVVVQPGGSRRDPEVIAACDELGLVMVLTGRRHFRH